MMTTKVTGLRIALGHQARVGKDTFADYIEEYHGCVRLSFAENVYKIATQVQIILGRPVTKEPALLQFIGDGLRNLLGEDIFVNSVMAHVRSIEQSDPDANILITDMRYPNEMKILSDHGFTTVKITRENRPIDRNPNHKSEIALLGAVFDVHLTNDESIEEFRSAVERLILELNK
jgi:hypothetical protein